MRTIFLIAMILTLSACVPIGVKGSSLPLAEESAGTRL
jgi:hypothetical protein